MKRILIISGIVMALLLLMAGVGLLILWRASQVVPAFYSEVLSADPAEQQSASDTMIQKATMLASDIQNSGRWEALFTEEELNGWLAVDLAENHGNSLPPGLADPRLVVEPGGLRMACRARRGGVETVLSVVLDVYLADPGVVGVRVRGVRAGSVPLPLSDVLDQIRDMGDRQGYLIRWQQAAGDPVALVDVNPVAKGDKPVVIDTLELAEGEIYLSGTTEEAKETE